MSSTVSGFGAATITFTLGLAPNRVTTVLLGFDGRGGATWYADVEQWLEHRGEQAPAPRRERRERRERPRRGGLSYLEQREYEAVEATILAAEEELAPAETRLRRPGGGLRRRRRPPGLRGPASGTRASRRPQPPLGRAGSQGDLRRCRWKPRRRYHEVASESVNGEGPWRTQPASTTTTTSGTWSCGS